jgi:hypothetical protein
MASGYSLPTHLSPVGVDDLQTGCSNDHESSLSAMYAVVAGGDNRPVEISAVVQVCT